MYPVFADAASAVGDALSSMWMEMCMFVLAILFYVLFSGNFTSISLGKTSKGKMTKAPAASRPVKAAAVGAKVTSRAVEAALQPLYESLRQGRLVEAVRHFQKLPSAAASVCSARLLVALAKVPALSEELMNELLDVEGKFSGKALEAAATEAQRRGDMHACRKLYQIAGLAAIPKTERALELIVRGHAADPVEMRALVEEITDVGSDSSSNSFAEMLLSLCNSADAGDETGAAMVGRAHANAEVQKHAKMISAAGKEGNLHKAMETFKALKDAWGPSSVLVHNCLLEACVQCDDLSVALQHFGEMKAAGLTDVVSYNTLMKGYLVRGEVGAARGLLEEMSATGVAATRITYHGLLNAVVSRGDRCSSWSLVEEMQAAGHPANAVTCSILLKGVTGASQRTDLARILKLADHVDKPLDEVLFGSVVEACIRTGSLDLLSQRMRSFAEQGAQVKLTSPTYGSMIKAYGQVHDVERVWELWTDMLARQVTPTAVTLGCMVEALVMNGCTEDAWELAQQLWENESQRASINTVVYSTILKGFAMSKKHDRVTALYEEMKERGISRNTITYNTILNSMARCGVMHRIPDLLEDMRTSEPRVEPDIVTYSTIIKGYCQSGELDKSLELLEQMRREAHIAPDEVMYNSLLDGCVRQNRMEDSLRLLEEMREANVAPSNYTLSIVCKLLGRWRRLAQAFAMVESVSKEYGFQPNIQVYTCLIQACFHNRQLGKALALHDQIVREGLWPDEKTYTVLARGCLQAGASEKAAMVVRCAYHLPCQGLQRSEGRFPGVDAKCLEDVLAELERTNPAAAKALQAEIQACPRPAPHGAGRPRGGAAQRNNVRQPAATRTR